MFRGVSRGVISLGINGPSTELAAPVWIGAPSCSSFLSSFAGSSSPVLSPLALEGPSQCSRSFATRSTQSRPNPYAKLLEEMKKPQPVSRNYMEKNFGILAPLGSYTTDYVVDPYTKKAGWPGLSNILKPEEWSHGGKCRSWLESVVQGWAAYSRTSAFESASDFRATALKLYTEINSRIADGRISLLQDAVSPNTFKELTLQAEKWRNSGAVRSEWRFSEPPGPQDVKIVRRRVFSADPNAGADAMSDPNKPTFSQITIRVKTKQVFAAYDKSGRVIAGDPSTPLEVVDHWVLEKVLAKNVQGSRWRLLKRFGPIDD